jgi:hypothetical protein
MAECVTLQDVTIVQEKEFAFQLDEAADISNAL